MSTSVEPVVIAHRWIHTSSTTLPKEAELNE